MSKNKWDWDFKLFDKYQISLTQYDTGGSYDPKTGVITLLTNSYWDGIFNSEKV